MQNEVKYPVGIQTFSKIIEKRCLYIDKTEYIYNMTHLSSPYVFLSRPRRFGKSLLTSTLHSYFEGRKELFKGLAIEKLEKEWVQYPVLHFDMSTAKYSDKDKLKSELNYILLQYESIYGKGEGEVEPNQRLQGLIKRAKEQSGKNVVVLIDEYDAPLLDVIHEEAYLKELRAIMKDFYSPLKKCEKDLHFVFLTGITKFSQLSIFSELNNLNNISMLEEYAGVCGITESEMIQQMSVGIEAIAEKQGWTKEKAIEELKANYDGYHFCYPSEDVYNPFSLLNAMSNRVIKSYWFGTGTPNFLIEMFKKFGVTPSMLGSKMSAMEEDFDAPTERMIDIVPLLYQSGYITIKDYDTLSQVYTLGIPNNEIRIGLFRNLLPNYIGSYTRNANTTAALMQVALNKDDVNEMLELLQTFLATIPQTNNTNYEGHWQQMLYVIFSLLGANVDVEVRTSNGRIDMVARTAKKLYLFELKLNKSAEAAMNQIDLKQYSERFTLSGLPIVKVAINFDTEKHNITDWAVS